MENFIDQVVTQTLHPPNVNAKGNLGLMYDKKYLTIKDNDSIKQIGVECLHDKELEKSWFEVRHECKFCKILKPRSELNCYIELNLIDKKYSLVTYPMCIGMSPYSNTLLHQTDICFDCTEKARKYLKICLNDAWSLVPIDIRLSKLESVNNLIFEYANPYYFHTANCESCGDERNTLIYKIFKGVNNIFECIKWNIGL